MPRVGFWVRESVYEEQPFVKFKHDLVLVLEGVDPDSTLTYSTLPEFQKLVDPTKLRISVVKVRRVAIRTAPESVK